jgi:hypothetical protein
MVDIELMEQTILQAPDAVLLVKHLLSIGLLHDAYRLKLPNEVE